MIIGIPKEIKEYENRVSMIPRSLSSMVTSGNKIVVETQAGDKSGFSDDDYIAVGASVVHSAEELYSRAQLIVKVKEIQVSKGEHRYLQPHHIIFGFNHFESNRELTEAAIKSLATFISFEKVVDRNGQTPLLMPMSKIAGAISALWAGFFQNYTFRHDGTIRFKTHAEQVRSKFVNDFEQIMSININRELRQMLSLQNKTVVIFGGGNVGELCAKICSALGSKVIIVEKREIRRKYLQETINQSRCFVISAVDRDMLRNAHIIIGSTYDKEKADRVIDQDMLRDISESRKKIIIDVAIDQGGNFPYIDPSGRYSPSSTGTIINPSQIDYFGNTFIRVPNIPSIVPRFASTALSTTIVEYVKDIVEGRARSEIANAISITGGKVVDEAINKAHNLK